MERRDFLKAGAVAGGSLGLSAVGCGAVLEGMSAVSVPSLAELSALNVDGFLKSLDSSLGFIRSTSSLDGILTKEVRESARNDPRLKDSEGLVRKTLRSLLLVGSFGDLTEAGQLHPGVQARMIHSLAEMDDAVIGMNRFMSQITPTERADIRRVLREDATVAPRVLTTLDDEAVKAGVNEKRRKHLLDVGKQACFRLRQSTDSFIGEYDEIIKKVSARGSSVEAYQRRLMAQMGEAAFWELHARKSALAQAWQQVPGIAQAAPTGSATGSAPPFAMTGAPPLGTLPPADSGLPPSPATSGSAQSVSTATAVATATAAGSVLVAPQAPVQPMSGGIVSPYAPPPVPPYSYAYNPILDPDIDEVGRSKKKLRKGNILLGVGAGMLGLGGILLGTGVAVLGSSGGALTGAGVMGMVALTFAALAGLGGIACLIVGGIIRSRA